MSLSGKAKTQIRPTGLTTHWLSFSVPVALTGLSKNNLPIVCTKIAINSVYNTINEIPSLHVENTIRSTASGKILQDSITGE